MFFSLVLFTYVYKKYILYEKKLILKSVNVLLSLLLVSVCRIDNFPLGGRNSVDFSYFECFFLGLSGSRFLGAFPRKGKTRKSAGLPPLGRYASIQNWPWKEFLCISPSAAENNQSSAMEEAAIVAVFLFSVSLYTALPAICCCLRSTE